MAAIHTPTPGQFNSLRNQFGHSTPGTPTPVNIPNTSTSTAYSLHGSPSQHPYSFENPSAGAYYHPSYYYHAPPSTGYTPTFNTLLPLHDTHSTTLNAPSTNNNPSGTLAAPAAPKTQSAASHCGVGPTNSSTPDGSSSESTAASTLPPPLHSNSTDLRNSGRRDLSKTTATDVWYFLWALNTDSEVEPQVRPTNEPILECIPKTEFVGCNLCTYVSSISNNY